MTRLGQQRAIAVLGGPPPVPAHVTMREMPPAHGLAVFKRDDVADDPVEEEEFAQEDVMRAVAEDVADGEDGVSSRRSRWGEGAVDGETICK